MNSKRCLQCGRKFQAKSSSNTICSDECRKARQSEQAKTGRVQAQISTMQALRTMDLEAVGCPDQAGAGCQRTSEQCPDAGVCWLTWLGKQLGVAV